MKTLPTASPASAPLDPEINSSARFFAVGILCGLLAIVSTPLITRDWIKAADLAEQLQARAHSPFAPLPRDAPVRQLVGLNSR